MPDFASRVRLVLVLLLLTAAWACNSPTDPEPVYDLQTKTFEGSLEIGGTASFPFTVVNPGDVTVMITQLSPTSTLPIGIHLGTWSAATSLCTPQLSTTNATVNAQFPATPNSAGDYCVTLFDIGNLQEPVAFTLRVTHY